MSEILEKVEFNITALEYEKIVNEQTTTVRTVAPQASTRTSNSNSSSNYSREQSRLSCVLCSGNHKVTECTKYKGSANIRDRVKRLELCYNCLSSKHKASVCPSKYTCRNCHCRHHTILCNNAHETTHKHPNRSSERFDKPSSSHTNTNSNTSSPTNKPHNSQQQHSSSKPKSVDNKNTSTTNTTNHTNPSVSSMYNSSDFSSAVLPTVQFKVVSNQNSLGVRALVDTGSQRSFISSKLAKQLRLPVVNKVSIRLSTFDGESPSKEFDVVKVKLQIGGYKLWVRLLVHDGVDTQIHCPGILQMHQILKDANVKLADPQIDEEIVRDVGILIGIDYFDRIITSQKRVMGINVFVTTNGVVPFGPSARWQGSIPNPHVSCSRITVEPNVESLWTLETIGIVDERYTANEKIAINKVTTEMQKTDEGYMVKLPFKGDETPSVNYRASVAQITSLINKFQRDLQLFEQYQVVIEDYLKRGFIESVELNKKSGCFLPHHPVIKESSTTPLRIVFNASSKPPGGRSLNDCMHTGPSLTQKIHDSILTFRQHSVAVVADISKAFHRIIIHPEHRKYTKFLWGGRDGRNLSSYQFRVVIFGACSSPYILQQVLQTHLSSSSLPGLENNFYVDNFQKTYSTVEAAVAEKPVVDEILDAASMPLQGWTSNSISFRSRFEVDEPSVQNMLGMVWNTDSDTLHIKVSKKFPLNVEEWKPSKRKFTAAIASVFDPLGLIGPLVVRAKVLLQSMWKLKLGWDQKLPSEIHQSASKLLKDLMKVSEFSFPRHVVDPGNVMHVFADASAQAFGAVAYSASRDEKGCNLLISKCRVAPCNSKTLTIPKLELTAVLIGCRLIKYLVSIFEFGEVYLWTDSQVVLSWIFRNNNAKDIYVSNRVCEIQNLVSSCCIQIKYIPSKINPADIISRGSSSKSLLSNQLWLHGPSLVELNKVEQQLTKVMTITTEITPKDPHPPIYSLDNVTTYLHAHNVMYYIAKTCRLTTEPLELLVRQEQRLHTPSLYAYVCDRNMRVTPDIKKTVEQLNLDVFNGTIRCVSRVTKAELHSDACTPLYLPRGSKLVQLYILYIHNKNRHCSTTQTMTFYRQSVWTPKLRTLVSSLLRRCVPCQLLRKRTVPRPPPPPLPETRIRYQHPYAVVGVDNTGSFKVRDTLEGRRYITIFVCTVTRHTHLEVSTSLSTEDFLHALRRMSAVYGTPKMILSDNGKNFIGAKRSLYDASKTEEFKKWALENNVRWQLQTPRSPWKGGHFERLISIVKSSLIVSLRHKNLNDEQFRTAVAEAQAVVNSRPLTYSSNDVEEEVLTPSHLVRGTDVKTLPLVEINDVDASRQARHQHTMLLQAIRQFSHRWRKEYLTSLLQRHEALKRNEPSHQFKEGDLVLLHVPHLARYRWPLAKVQHVYPDDRGVIRSVKVLCNGQSYLRPVNQLVPLELDGEAVAAQSADREEEEKEEEAVITHSESTPSRMGEVEESPTRTVEEASSPLNVDPLSEHSDDTSDSHPTDAPIVGRPIRKAALAQRARLRDLLVNDML